MLNSEISSLTQDAHPDFRRDFDAHIYFHDAATRAHAAELRERALRDFAGQPLLVGELVDRPVGPHPTPMFEINCRKEDRVRLYDWLEAHRGPLSVLLHVVTNHDHRDHDIGAVWLGEPVVLDPKRLDPDPA